MATKRDYRHFELELPEFEVEEFPFEIIQYEKQKQQEIHREYQDSSYIPLYVPALD
jgi:hypothetical protein